MSSEDYSCSTKFNHISLCSGYDGLGIAIKKVVPNLRNIAMVEREAFAVANLVAKMEEGKMDTCPIFTDVRSFPWELFAPAMGEGVLSFGWPCQPVSVAGVRKGTKDERWLFDDIADGISILRPRWLFAENVEGLLSAKMPDGSLVFAHCIERLESLHYKVEAGIFSAEEVGAPHLRKRVFIMAHNNDALREQQGGSRRESWENEKELRVRSSGLAHSDSSRKPQQPTIKREGRNRFINRCQELADSGDEGSQGWLSRRQDKKRESVDGYLGCGSTSLFTRWPSRPGETQHNWEEPRVKPGLGRTASRTSNRIDRLRMLGNGVVPQTAERAFRCLLERFK